MNVSASTHADTTPILIECGTPISKHIRPHSTVHMSCVALQKAVHNALAGLAIASRSTTRHVSHNGPQRPPNVAPPRCHDRQPDREDQTRRRSSTAVDAQDFDEILLDEDHRLPARSTRPPDAAAAAGGAVQFPYATPADILSAAPPSPSAGEPRTPDAAHRQHRPRRHIAAANDGAAGAPAHATIVAAAGGGMEGAAADGDDVSIEASGVGTDFFEPIIPLMDVEEEEDEYNAFLAGLFPNTSAQQVSAAASRLGRYCCAAVWHQRVISLVNGRPCTMCRRR